MNTCPLYPNFFIFAAQNALPDLKKILIYSILALFLFNSMGYYCLFELNRFLARKEMKLSIQQEPVSLIILKIADPEHDHDFHRTDGKEIEYKSELYDVVREITHGRNRVFICVHDSKEEGLYSGLKMVHVLKIQLALWEHLIKVTFPEPPVLVANISVSDLIFPFFRVPLESSLVPTWSPPPEQS